MREFKDKLSEIAYYGKLLHTNKLVIGPGGNISVRDGDSLIIKKKNADMSDGDFSDYVQIPFQEVKHAEEGLLSSETPLHIACYDARPDVEAVIHVHSPYIIAASGKTRRLESPSYEFDCIITESVPVIDYIRPGSKELAEEIAAKLKQGSTCVMMEKHGATSVGKSLEEAYLRMLALERACITFLNS